MAARTGVYWRELTGDVRKQPDSSVPRPIPSHLRPNVDVPIKVECGISLQTACPSSGVLVGDTPATTRILLRPATWPKDSTSREISPLELRTYVTPFQLPAVLRTGRQPNAWRGRHPELLEVVQCRITRRIWAGSPVEIRGNAPVNH